MIRRFLQPYFVYRPLFVVRAILRKLRSRPERAVVKLPWGDSLEVRPHEAGGHRLYMHGIHDLPVCELIFRLVQPGDCVVDVGANLGFMTSALSYRVGNRGKVFSFEANPHVYEDLLPNVERMQCKAAITLRNLAVSNVQGTLEFVEGTDFAGNRGTGHVKREQENRDGAAIFNVPCVRLDDVLAGQTIRLLKIDVERHEPEVLQGAMDLLQSKMVRHIVFEDWDGPTEMQQTLRQLGYHLFRIDYSMRGVRLETPAAARKSEDSIADFLATLDEPQALASKVVGGGWSSLRGPLW